MNYNRKYIFKSLKIGAILILVIITGIVIYVTANKDKIIKQVIVEMEDRLDGNLTVGKVELSFIRNFPSVSVLLHNVSLTDTMFNSHKHIFFQGKEVFVSLSLPKLIRKQPPLKGLRIDNGEIYLFTDTTGYTNAYLLGGKKNNSKPAKASQKSELKDIELNNVRVIINDLKRRKLHDLAIKRIKVKVNDEADMSSFSTKADILIRSLAFNINRGSFLKDKTLTGNFDLRIIKKNQQLQFDSINIKISGQPFNMTGRFDLASGSPQFSLRLYSRKISYPFISSLLPQKIASSLSIVALDKPLDVSADLNGPLKVGDPVVIARWTAKNTGLKTPFLDFDKASFSGFFTNEVVAGFPRKDPNSKIHISGFTAEWHGLPIVSNSIEINNLTVPLLTCDMSSSFDLKDLNELVGSNSLKLLKGEGVVKLDYKGPIVRNNNTNSFLNGEILFKNGSVLYAPRDVEMSKLNGKMVFRNSDVFIENLQTVVLGQQVIMQGQAKNLLTLINTDPDKANINWSIYSPALDLGAFTFLLKARKKSTEQNGNKKQLADVATKLDRLLEQGRLQVQLKAGKLLYKKFAAMNVLADISLLQDRYLINNVSMDHAGGHMGMNGSLISNSGNLHQARVNVSMDNVNVSKVLQSFDNFGQDGITYESLEGKLFTKLSAAMMINADGRVLPESIVSMVDFSLKNGALNNYEPIKKLQRFVFKNRDFENIRFAELKDRLEIKNQEIKINRMEIQSTVISMFVEGIYSRIGNTDMSIQVPFSNLKKRTAEFNPENIGADKKGGNSIYIRGRPGPDGNIKFKLDLFNKFDKEKEKKP